MKQTYPKLSEYLLSMFKYNKYRKIEAHDIPKIRMSNGIAYIPVSGTNKEGEMKSKLKKWLVVNRRGNIYVSTDDLDLAWSICESSAACGNHLTVTTKEELKNKEVK